ncbi:hypothetical protein GN958_ATG02939, partial [Phytophthora infestans]
SEDAQNGFCAIYAATGMFHAIGVRISRCNSHCHPMGVSVMKAFIITRTVSTISITPFLQLQVRKGL